VRWEYSDRPFRISALSMDIDWPGVPASRVAAASRAAAHCTLHNTLTHPPRVETRVHRVANRQP